MAPRGVAIALGGVLGCFDGGRGLDLVAEPARPPGRRRRRLHGLRFLRRGLLYAGFRQRACATAASTIPTATWNTNSTCAIIGYTSNTSARPGGLGQTFGNFTWNCPSQTGTIDLGGALAAVKGNLTVTSTGSSTLRLSGNLTVGGNFSMSSGTLDMTSGTLSTVTLTIGGNFGHTGGTLTVSGF